MSFLSRHFHRELEQLNRDLVVLGGLVESAVTRALEAFFERDDALARQVIEGDSEINALELRIEEECLKVMALYAPTAKDLRFVVGVFKITNDLERVGDLAQNIAERARRPRDDSFTTGFEEMREMGERVRKMLNVALDSFVSMTTKPARDVLAMDDRVDELLRKLYDLQEAAVTEDGARFGPAVLMLSCGKYLERIADHCTNIAEDVIYMAEGDVIRHSI